MDFDLSKAQRLLKQSARDLLARECKPEHVRRAMATETAFDAALWQSIAEQGWTGLIVPEAQGGLALGIVELAAVAEECGRACMPGPFLSTVLATAVVSRLGSAEQQTRYLEPIAAGEMKATVAILEQGANWDLGSTRCKASLSRDAFLISGEQHFVPDAGVADVILCVLRSGDA